MKKIKRSVYISGITATTIVLIGLFAFMKLYNKPHTDVHTSKPDHTITSKMLIEAFKTDEGKANKTYLDKILQVEGIIKNVSIADGKGAITLGMENSLESVICNMSPEENKKISGLHKGQEIVIRGICTGFLMDVVIVRAVIAHKPKNI